MAMIDGNGNPQRLGRPTGPIKPRTPTLDAPPKGPEAEAAAPKPKTDNLKVATRPVSDQERLKAAVAAAQAAGAEKPKAKEEEKPTTKVVADVVGTADAVKEGIKIASSVDELEKLPILGRAMRSGGRLGNMGAAFARTSFGAAVAHAIENGKIVAPMVKGLGRIAPVAGVVVAGFDIADAVKTNKDPKASGTEKMLANVKAGLSAVSAGAGVAALALAPTGVGAAVAGGIALGAGLLSMGVDLVLGKMQDDRKKAEKK